MKHIDQRTCSSPLVQMKERPWASNTSHALRLLASHSKVQVLANSPAVYRRPFLLSWLHYSSLSPLSWGVHISIKKKKSRCYFFFLLKQKSSLTWPCFSELLPYLSSSLLSKTSPILVISFFLPILCWAHSSQASVPAFPFRLLSLGSLITSTWLKPMVRSQGAS